VIPVVFRTPRSLCALNVGAVGLAIAAMTTAAFTLGDPEHGNWAIIVGIPSLLVGTLWATMLRRRETIGPKRIPVGWVLSVPLAAFNGSLACAMLFTMQEPRLFSFIGGAILGATFGVLLWAPGLLLVLMVFGVPIAHARHLAQRGLASEDRGERFVGLACAVIAVTTLAVSHASLPFAVLAAASGIAAAWIALRREARRRRFVARVEADEVPGFRVDWRTSGKMLVRVEPHVETYRIAPQPDEELIELDADGRAMRMLR